MPGVIVAPGYLANLSFLEIPWSAEITRLGAAAFFVDRLGQGKSGGKLWSPAAETLLLHDMQPDIAAAIAYLRSRAGIDPDRIAILGHSDGATAAISAATADWDIRATVAVSASVAPSGFVNHVAPQDLLLVYGADDRFVLENTDVELIRRATRGYLDAPGVRGDALDGSARRLVRIPGRGHVDVLYSREAHDAALNWIGDSLDVSGPRVPLSSRIGWIWLGLLGFFAALATAPTRALRSDEGGCDPQGARQQIWLAAFVVTGWFTGLSASPYLCRSIGFLIPAWEGATFFFILAAPLITLSAVLGAYRLISGGALALHQGRLGIPHVLYGIALAATTYVGTWLLLRHHYEVWLGSQRVVLMMIVGAAGLPLFLLLDGVLPLAIRCHSRETSAALLIVTAITPVWTHLLFERMSVLPGYLLTLVLLLFAVLRWAHPTHHRSVAVGCGLTIAWLAGVVCTLY